MKRFLYATGLALALLPAAASGQHKWTLRECIEYAVENNIQIRQTQIAVEESGLDVRDSRNARLPSLGADLSQNFGFGRAPSPEDNTYFSSQTASTNVGASTSMPIYQGGALRGRIKVSELDNKAAIENLKIAKENLELNVANYYLNVLYYKEVLRVYEQSTELARKQVERVEVLVKTGMAPMTELLESRSQYANTQVQYINALGGVEDAMLALTQALNLESMTGFDIAEPELDGVPVDLPAVFSPEDVFARAVEVKPHIREQELRLESSLANVRVARSALFPSIGFSASYGNGYSYIFGNNFNEGFGRQIRTRGSEGVGIGISIPIYNRGMTRSNIKRAQLGVLSRELNLENTKIEIYKEIQQACVSARNAVATYGATETAAEAAAAAYKLTEESFGLGVVTALDLDDSRTKLTQSLSEQVRSKYEYLFRMKILDFYRGIPITL